MKNWRTKTSEIVHSNPWYDVRHDQVVRPDGADGDYYVVETRGAAVFTVLLNDADEILLIRQERYTSSLYSWEVPGGNSDGQDPLVAAQRELVEETGYSADEWVPVGITCVMNGISSEKSYMYVARASRRATETMQAEEGITSMRWVSWPSVWEMVRNGDITDNQTITALTEAALHLNKI